MTSRFIAVGCLSVLTVSGCLQDPDTHAAPVTHTVELPSALRAKTTLHPPVAEDVARQADAPQAGIPFAHVIQADHPYIVLWSQDVPDGWATGGYRIANDNPVVVARLADESKLPHELTALRGARMTVMSATGETCRGTIKGLSLVGRQFPPFGALSHWFGDEGERTPDPQEMGASMWQDSAKVVAARLDIEAGSCHGALWARSAELPPAPVARPEPLHGPLRAAALRAFRSETTWQATQARYLEEGPATSARWDDVDDGPKVVQFSLGDAPIVAVSAEVWSGGCASFTGSMLTLYHVADSELEPVSQHEAAYVNLEAAIQLEPGHAPTLLFQDAWQQGILKESPAGYVSRDELDIPDYRCPC